MMKSTDAVALAAVIAAMIALPAAAAGEDDALIDKAAVRNRLFTVDKRFELGVNVGFSLLPRLTEHYTLNVSASFNMMDTLAFELLAGGSFARHTSLARDVATQFGRSTTTTVDDLSDLWTMVADAVIGLRWQPLYGKIGIFSELPIHFQFYLWLGGGAGFFQRQSLVICNRKSGEACDQYFSEHKVTAIVSAAAGVRFFVPTYGNKHSVRLEVRDFSYPDSYLVGVNRAAALDASSPTGGGSPAKSPGLTNLVQIAVGYSFIF